MATQITANLPTLNFPREVDYPTQEDWAAFSAAAELNFGILGGDWSTQMQLWKTQANAMSTELNTNSTIAQGLANYQGDWTSKGYTLGQTVSVSGVYYICKLTHATGQNPTTGGSIYWNLAIGNWNLKVNNYSDESITGIKSFASKILAPKLAYKDTLVTINTWSYSTTTITLNVTSHTFIAGDYIEISGLTSTKNAPNGIYLVTSVTTGTIVFTAYATPTGTTGVSTAMVKGSTTLNGKIISEDIGINQSWQSVTRLSATNYVNTTNRMILIAFYGSSSAINMQINLTITPIGTTTAINIPIGTTSNIGYGGFNFSIPVGCTYKIAPVSGTFTIAEWYEFR